MPNVVQCPSCSRKLRVPDDLLGEDVLCPSCRTEFTAADPAQGPPGPDEGVTASRPQSSRGRAESGDYEEVHDLEEARPRPAKGKRPKKRQRLVGFRDHRGGLIVMLGAGSLVFGMASLGVNCCRPFGVMGVIGLPLGIVAFMLAMGDLPRIRAREMDPSGEGPTKVGWICSMVGVPLCLLGLVLVVVEIILTFWLADQGPGKY